MTCRIRSLTPEFHVILLTGTVDIFMKEKTKDMKMQQNNGFKMSCVYVHIPGNRILGKSAHAQKHTTETVYDYNRKA